MQFEGTIPFAMLAPLLRRYAEPHRRYHTWDHIAACFQALGKLADAPPHYAAVSVAPKLPHLGSCAVSLAILYHDAIYDPMASDNEEKSALLLLEERGKYVAPSDRDIRAAAYAIRLTKYSAPPEALLTSAPPDGDKTAAILHDVDLSILGSPPETYAAFERFIQLEYPSVPAGKYFRARKLILQSFLDRPSIYQLPAAKRLWEDAARENLAHWIKVFDAYG